MCMYVYIYIYIYLYIYTDIFIYIHMHVFRPSQDSSVCLGLTSKEQLMSQEANIYIYLLFSMS